MVDNKEEGEEEDAEKNARGSIGVVVFVFSCVRIQPRARSSVGDGTVLVLLAFLKSLASV